MSDMTTVEIKAFVPARDFALSKSFYQELGFVVAWSSDDLAYLRHGNTSFFAAEFL
jgi:catechol 2,3-dioxygenase-like lactoylglutathione lyase family enzyme